MIHLDQILQYSLILSTMFCKSFDRTNCFLCLCKEKLLTKNLAKKKQKRKKNNEKNVT